MRRETVTSGRRPRDLRGRLLGAALVAIASIAAVSASPRTPTDDNEVLANLPPGTAHNSMQVRKQATERIDVALPLAQFYISEAVLTPWVTRRTAAPAALVLEATVQQSRHEFDSALATLDRALAAAPNDAQAWLTRATVLRVRGRYSEAAAACAQFARWADAGVSLICEQGIEGLMGHLAAAYATLRQLSPQGMLVPERAWRESELGEMAVRLGRDADAEHWFREALAYSPDELYIRGAYADLLLRQRRYGEVLALLKGRESIEPMLLRIAIAQKQLRDPALARSRELLQAAFTTEAQRGEAVHRREQARFLLEVEDLPQAALAAALANWAVQREPDDVLILVSAARAAGTPQSAYPALEFVQSHGLLDARLAVSAGARA